MNSLRITLIATLLTASSAYADEGGYSSARIGTGLPWSNSQDVTPSTGTPSAPHWSAYIGTGRASSSAIRPDSENTAPAMRASNGARPDWTSRIGTGHASATIALPALPPSVASRPRS
jgi:hypothetical protein